MPLEVGTVSTKKMETGKWYLGAVAMPLEVGTVSTFISFRVRTIGRGGSQCP